jgi:hypothetical protein
MSRELLKYLQKKISELSEYEKNKERLQETRQMIYGDVANDSYTLKLFEASPWIGIDKSIMIDSIIKQESFCDKKINVLKQELNECFEEIRKDG